MQTVYLLKFWKRTYSTHHKRSALFNNAYYIFNNSPKLGEGPGDNDCEQPFLACTPCVRVFQANAQRERATTGAYHQFTKSYIVIYFLSKPLPTQLESCKFFLVSFRLVQHCVQFKQLHTFSIYIHITSLVIRISPPHTHTHTRSFCWMTCPL